MKTIILPTFVVLTLLLNIIFVPLRVLAKELGEIKINCPTISSTLPFEKSPESSSDYMGCNSYTGEDIAVSDTFVVLSGNISLDPLLGDANKSRSNDVPPSKMEDLLIGDGGKIIYWGPPWGKGPHSQVEFRAKLGLCDMELTGYASGNITLLLKSGNSNPDWQTAGDFMVEKLSKAAREIEANIAAECGAKNAIDAPRTGQKTKPPEQKSRQIGSGTDFFQAISENFQDVYLAKAKFVEADTDVLNTIITRAPGLTEEIIKNAQEGQVREITPQVDETISPYRLDILNGQIQIKLPGQNEWSDLKQGDRIPPGSTIFTGMDTTTVLSIQNKGVVQILPFTEVIISEEGLSQQGKTTTDIKLQRGEIEVKIDPYIPSTPSDMRGSQGWGMSIYGPFYSAAVRGTHFWVKQEEGKNMATIGVYNGKVEVKVSGSDKSTFISPNGDKPGVIMVARKLSPTKLALIGVASVIVVGGVVRLLKRRGNIAFHPRKR